MMLHQQTLTVFFTVDLCDHDIIQESKYKKTKKKQKQIKRKDKKYKNSPNPNPKSYLIKSSDAKVKYRWWVDKERTIILSNKPTSSIID